MDETEDMRRERWAQLNQEAPQNRDTARGILESRHGQVWDTAELGEAFEVIGFSAPFVVVKRRSDGQKGSLEFQHSPRYYFNFEPYNSGFRN